MKTHIIMSLITENPANDYFVGRLNQSPRRRCHFTNWSNCGSRGGCGLDAISSVVGIQAHLWRRALALHPVAIKEARLIFISVIWITTPADLITGVQRDFLIIDYNFAICFHFRYCHENHRQNQKTQVCRHCKAVAELEKQSDCW